MTELHPDAEALIKRFEGCRLQAYDDATGKPLAADDTPQGIPTIGWGRTRGVRPGMVCTQAQADAWFEREIERVTDGVLELVRRDPSDTQLGAMVSLAYNIGLAGFARSTVLKAFNRGDDESAARAFGLWDRSQGKRVAGLTRRRKAEAALYLRPAGEAAEEPMPQRVDPESSLARSPIAISGAAVSAVSAAAAPAVSALATARDAAESVGGIREGLGDWLPYLLIVLLAVGVVAGLVILYQRAKQRAQGWA